MHPALAARARRGFEKGANATQRAAAKDRTRLEQARAAVEAALADVEAARRTEQEAVAIAKEAAAEVRCAALGFRAEMTHRSPAAFLGKSLQDSAMIACWL